MGSLSTYSKWVFLGSSRIQTNKHCKEYYVAYFCWWIPSSCENYRFLLCREVVEELGEELDQNSFTIINSMLNSWHHSTAFTQSHQQLTSVNYLYTDSSTVDIIQLPLHSLSTVDIIQLPFHWLIKSWNHSTTFTQSHQQLT